MASFAQLVSSLSGVSIAQNNYTSYASYVEYLTFSIADAQATEPAGIFSLLASRLLPRHLFTTRESITSVVDAVIYGLETARTFLPGTGTQVVFETPLSTPDLDNTTSALPAWRDAIWHVIHVGEWEQPLTPAVQEKATKGFLGLFPTKAYLLILSNK